MKISATATALYLTLSITNNAYALAPPIRTQRDVLHASSSSLFSQRRSIIQPSSSRRRTPSSPSSLSSIAPQQTSSSSSDAKTKISNELSRGVTLDNGPVIDFASVKDSTSRAERALSEARKRYERSLLLAVSSTETTKKGEDGRLERLMGINDEVVQEVGYEIGQFVQEYVDTANGETVETLVQNCGAWLRSKAKEGTFSKNNGDSTTTASTTTTSFTTEDIARYERLLSRAYEESGIVTSAFAKTFYLGTQGLPEPAKKAIWAIYVWCRRTDEIVDAPRPQSSNPNEEMLTDLSEWEIRTEKLFECGQVVDVLDLPLLDCKVKYPKLPVTPFADMIRGMLMDIPGLGQERYETWEELHLYCYRVAGTVGLMSMPVFGCAEGYTDEIAKEPALSLGVAFQITNILRDVGEDAKKRERVYLPQEDMKRFGVTERQLFDQIVDENYINLMKFEIARARMYYARALRGVPMLSPDARLPVQLSLDAYGKILDKIEENGYDSLTKRAYVGKWEKLAGVPASWYRTLEIANVFPLPGDWGRPTLEDYEKELAGMLENNMKLSHHERVRTSATSDYLHSLNK